MRPLDGILVVAVEQAVAAPFATRQLADLGARVIKIERPVTGDFAREYDHAVQGMGASFVWLNRSKESLTLNLKEPKAIEVVMRLLEGADVFLQNLAPGAAGRLGLSFEALHAKFPRLIVCDISGYGDTGPYRDKKAYDLLIQAESGLISITGTPDEPSKAGISIADISSGMYAYSGILAALLQRSRTGEGARVEVSMLEALCEWMQFPLYYTQLGGLSFPRSGAHHPAICPYGPFRTAGGKMLIIGIQNEREWKKFCELVLRAPELTEDTRFNSVSRRVASREDLTGIVERTFAKFELDELVKLLDQVGIANAAMNDLEAVWNHKQLQSRDRWRSVESPTGSIKFLLPPGIPGGFEPRAGPIPEVGEHTDPILGAIGYSPDQIAQFRKAGVI